MIRIRPPESIYQAEGTIQGGTFQGRWHFSFDTYYDPAFVSFGALKVFNDDRLSHGAIWPLHPHRNIEVVTYCAEGEFRHADERGKGGVLRKGDVQHTTVGRGIMHSEINNRSDEPMRFIQQWIIPDVLNLPPSVEQRHVERSERTNRFLPLVSNRHEGALPIAADAAVHAAFLEKGKAASHPIAAGRGVYLYVVEGGPVTIGGHLVPEFGAAMIMQERSAVVAAIDDAELLLVDVTLDG